MSEPEQKPIIDKVKEYVPDTNDVKDAFQSATTAVSNGIDNVKTGVQNTLGEFSEKGAINASNEFLESNGLFAKFAFLILVLIIFLFLFKLGIHLISYFSQSSKSPFIIKGLLEGSSLVTISQNPSVNGSVPISRSVNANNGVEFTWSVWLLLQYNKSSTSSANANTIFVKGTSGTFTNKLTDNNKKEYGNINTVNGPGMYITLPSDLGYVNLNILMDDIKGKTNQLTIETLPLNKWVHIAYRLQNTVLDSYVNGVISQRVQMDNAPKQNFYDILVAPNGGFQGQLSNLQYFNRALNVFEINNIVMFGPNLSNSKHSNSAKNATGNYSYLNTSWYSGWYNSIG